MAIHYSHLASHQASRLCDAIRSVYGDTYPNREFYDVEHVQRCIEEKRLYTVIAEDEQQNIAGCMSTVLEQEGDYTADGSALLVAEAFRGQGVVSGLGEQMLKTYIELGLGALHLYALALHERVQVQSANASAVVTGVLPAWFSRSATVSGYAYPDARIGAVALYMPLGAVPERHCYLPDEYADVLDTLYERLPVNRYRSRALPSVSKPAHSLTRLELKPSNEQARLVVERTGEDYSLLIDRLLSASTSRGLEVCYIDISLSDPAVAQSVAIARARGFFFGALIVERCGSDKLRLQRYAAEIAAPEAMVLASSEAEALLATVIADQQSVS